MLKRFSHLFLLATLFMGIGPGNAWAGAEIVIGVATSLKTLEGRESLKAVELAVSEINAGGGVAILSEKRKLRIASCDLSGVGRQGNVSDALNVLEHFILSQKIDAIAVGPFRSEVLLAGMDIIAKYRVPLLGAIAMSSATEVKIMRNPAYKYIFRIGLNSSYLVEYLINAMKLLRRQYGFNKVYIINQDVAWARTTASQMIRLYFDRKGWEVTGVDTYPYDADDFETSLRKAGAKGAQVLLPIFDMPQSGFLVEQWNRKQIPLLICGFISPMVGPGAWETFDGHIAGALNVIYELGNIPAQKYKPAKTFADAFKKSFGQAIEAGHGPAPAYESVYILADAIQRANSLDPDLLVTALEATDRQGAMGRIRFHKGHQALFGKDPHKAALACIIQWSADGRRKIIYPPAIAETEVKLPAFMR